MTLDEIIAEENEGFESVFLIFPTFIQGKWRWLRTVQRAEETIGSFYDYNGEVREWTEVRTTYKLERTK